MRGGTGEKTSLPQWEIAAKCNISRSYVFHRGCG